MRKSKLELHRETLRQLSTASLGRARGGYGVVSANSAVCGLTVLTPCYPIDTSSRFVALCH